jgi:hypothetical protein
MCEWCRIGRFSRFSAGSRSDGRRWRRSPSRRPTLNAPPGTTRRPTSAATSTRPMPTGDAYSKKWRHLRIRMASSTPGHGRTRSPSRSGRCSTLPGHRRISRCACSSTPSDPAVVTRSAMTSLPSVERSCGMSFGVPRQSIRMPCGCAVSRGCTGSRRIGDLPGSLPGRARGGAAGDAVSRHLGPAPRPAMARKAGRRRGPSRPSRRGWHDRRPRGRLPDSHAADTRPAGGRRRSTLTPRTAVLPSTTSP